MNQEEIKKYQQQKEERFQQSLFKDQIQNIDPPTLNEQNNPDFVKLIIICTYTQDTIATKEKIICSENEVQQIEYDDVIEFQDLSECIKKEIILYIERSLIDQIKLLKASYIEKQDTIKLPICSANGIRIPNEYDVKQFFKLLQFKNDNEQFIKQFKLLELKHQYGILISSLIFQTQNVEEIIIEQFIQNLNIEIAIKLLLITVQYESNKQNYFFKLIQHLYYLSKGLLKESYDPIYQKLIQNGMKPKQLQVEKPNFIKLITQLHIIKINSTILYPLFKQQEAQLFQFYKPIREIRQYTIHRNYDISEGKELSEFPHIYQLKNQEKQTIMIAIQQEVGGEIMIFQELQEKYIKYSDLYLGFIEFKIQGKEFIVYDDGYPEYMENSFPQWISRKKRKMIIFDYFSDKRYDKPRQFDIKAYNINTQQFEEIITKESQYDETKHAFTLELKNLASIPSTRNFILQKKNEDGTLEQIMLHGKTNRHSFIMEIYPGISVFQSFCISIVSICSKISCQ